MVTTDVAASSMSGLESPAILIETRKGNVLLRGNKSADTNVSKCVLQKEDFVIELQS